jgi:hypothetical protein
MTRDWSRDAVAAEFSRLAYRRFEVEPQEKQVIADAIAAAGYGEIGGGAGWFHDIAEKTTFSAKGFGAIDDDGGAIIAFRGTQTDNVRDFLTDIRVALEDWEHPGRVHSGFSASLSTILAPVEQWLADTAPEHLVLTGHSLGAALATLLAARLAPQGRSIELVTFGSPRVGDEALVASLRPLAVRRYVNCTDAVTQLPPPLLYYHVEGLHYIDRAGRIHVGEPLPISMLKDQRAAHRAYLPLMWRAANLQWRGLADHAPINYVSALLGAGTAAD